jgi:putative flavoprotein involved in K+ transport
MTVDQHVETVIVGGGQAGLAVGYYLKSRNRDFVILDASERVGDSWRKRWPSLRLYSPANADGLPGMPFPAPRNSFPSGQDMADYLEAYVGRMELPVESGVGVDSVQRNGSGFVVTAGGRRLGAENVVIATGVFQQPMIPEFARELDPAITQLHSADYRSPDQLQSGPVLVVGAAHSGGDIAYEVARAGFSTILSGRDTGQIPFDTESRLAPYAYALLKFAWTRVVTLSTPVGRKAKQKLRVHGGPLIRVKRADLAAAGIERVFERTVGVEDGRPMLAERTSCGARGSATTTRGSSRQCPRKTTGSRCSDGASSRRCPVCTSSGSRSCTRSRRCSSSALGATASALRNTSSRACRDNSPRPVNS